MLTLYEVVKYFCLEMCICVIYTNEIMPQGYQMTDTLGPYRMPTTWRQYTQKQNNKSHNAANMNLRKNEQCIYENSAH